MSWLFLFDVVNCRTVFYWRSICEFFSELLFLFTTAAWSKCCYRWSHCKTDDYWEGHGKSFVTIAPWIINQGSRFLQLPIKKNQVTKSPTRMALFLENSLAQLASQLPTLGFSVLFFAHFMRTWTFYNPLSSISLGPLCSYDFYGLQIGSVCVCKFFISKQAFTRDSKERSWKFSSAIKRNQESSFLPRNPQWFAFQLPTSPNRLRSRNARVFTKSSPVNSILLVPLMRFTLMRATCFGLRLIFISCPALMWASCHSKAEQDLVWWL